jgi:S-adenosylmethionine:tRNA ribosyltransferase-isomerase
VLTTDFDYELPPAAIAQRPTRPRDAARLLDCRNLEDRAFGDLPEMLDEGDLVVVNTTRVRAARLRGRKVETGGAVEILLLERSENDVWNALIRPARRIHAGTRLTLGSLDATVLDEPSKGRTRIRLEGEHVEAVISSIGEVPLPPYIKTPPEDPSDYQTVFADRVGSAAAPTAGLHFTKSVLAGLERRGIDIAEIDLHVGVDTFRPIDEEHVEDHPMHSERFEIAEDTVAAFEAARRRGGKVVAIGTTVVRALESAVGDGTLRAGSASTSLYIRPGYRFKAVDAMVTNFHVPRSTLLVLVAAFVGDEWRYIYETALERGYRFLSFGDAMYAQRQ